MRICKQCLMTDLRPGMKFNDLGVCLPCDYDNASSDIDWDQRYNQLLQIVSELKGQNGEYDCIVGVSGGKDSTRQALIIKELGLNPLLISCSTPPDHVTELGAYNLENLIKNGFDCINLTPSPLIWKRLMKEAFIEFGNYCKATELALYSTTIRLALAHGIDTIFLGENNAISYGEATSSLGGEADLESYNTLSGGVLSEQIHKKLFSAKELVSFNFPSRSNIQNSNLVIYYLGYYIRDFNNYKNAEVAIDAGLKIREVNQVDIGAINLFDALDDDFVAVNQMIKYLKFGFGKATEELCEAIRLGMISRSEAINLQKKIDGKCNDKYIKNFCNYLDIDQDFFWEVVDRFVNKSVFEKEKTGKYIFKK